MKKIYAGDFKFARVVIVAIDENKRISVAYLQCVYKYSRKKKRHAFKYITIFM